jgi:hypothetical protein
VLGAPVVHDERGFSYVHGIPGAPFESLDFVRVPEAKTVRNLIHPGFVAAGVFALLTARGDSHPPARRRDQPDCAGRSRRQLVLRLHQLSHNCASSPGLGAANRPARIGGATIHGAC